jgi:hypothetical protein
VITYVLDEDGTLINEETGEPMPVEEDPAPSETLPDWLWQQHLAQPPREVEP